MVYLESLGKKENCSYVKHTLRLQSKNVNKELQMIYYFYCQTTFGGTSINQCKRTEKTAPELQTRLSHQTLRATSLTTILES